MDLYCRFKTQSLLSLKSKKIPVCLGHHVFLFCELYFQQMANMHKIRDLFINGSSTVHIVDLPFKIDIKELLSITKPVWKTNFSHFCCNNTGVMFFHENENSHVYQRDHTHPNLRGWKTKRYLYSNNDGDVLSQFKWRSIHPLICCVHLKTMHFVNALCKFALGKF